MRHECPFCGHSISKSWLFFSLPGGSDYICPHCHAHLKATPLRYVINVFVVTLAYFIMMESAKKIGMGWEWFAIVLPLVGLIYFTAFWFTPGQYKMVHPGYKNNETSKTH